MGAMRHPALLALLFAGLVLAGCAGAPGRIFGAGADRPPAPVAGPAGSSIPASPSSGPGGYLDLPPGVYLASFITLDVNTTDFPVPIAIGPHVGVFPAGEIAFVVVNKWGGLGPGDHRVEIVILAPDGATILATDRTDFGIRAEQVFFTVAAPLSFTATAAGFYQVIVTLDDRKVARYHFEVRARPG